MRFLTTYSATQRRYTPGTILLIVKVVRASKVQPIHTPSIRMNLQEVATKMPLTPWSSASVTSSLIQISTTPVTQTHRITNFSSSLQNMISRLTLWDSKALKQKLMKRFLLDSSEIIHNKLSSKNLSINNTLHHSHSVNSKLQTKVT